jgi:hypothetical protein
MYCGAVKVGPSKILTAVSEAGAAAAYLLD